MNKTLHDYKIYSSYSGCFFDSKIVKTFFDC